MHNVSPASRPLVTCIAVVCGALALAPAGVGAQTSYHNTDTGRPTRVEDAYALERYALDMYLAPRVERVGDATAVLLTPELTYGLVPRTQIDLSVPAVLSSGVDGEGGAGIAGIDISTLHGFNAETRSWPAFGLRAGILMPVGKYASDRPHPYVTGVLTRTIRGTRFHGNVQYTLGAEPDRGYPIGGSAGFGSGSLSRWLTGIAADRAFAYRSLLVSAEVLAAGSMVDDAAVEWSAATGLRYQLTPTLILDGGVGRRLTGPAQAWYLTAGVARVTTLRFLFPGRGAWGRS